MGKQKTRKLSISSKILMPAAVLLIMICTTIAIVIYRQVYTNMVALGVQQADMASKVAVSQINGDLLQNIEPGKESSEVYKGLLASMRQLRDACGIKYLYTLYTDGETIYYGVDADDSAGQQEIGAVFDFPYEEFKDVFEGTPYVQDYIDKTEDGDLISAYRPVYNRNGDIVGIVGCDYDATNIVEYLNTILVKTIGISTTCLVFALIVMYLIIRTITANLRKVDSKLYELVNNEGDLTQHLDINTGDETELIGNKVNRLLEYIREIMLKISCNSVSLNESSRVIVQDLHIAETNIADVSACMQEMSAAMQETNASLSQINESIVDVYNSIDTISLGAQAGKQSSDVIMENAAQIYENAVTDQQNAKELAQKMATSVNEKIEKSKAVQKISELTSDIIGITSQTNLLALNASIEAARAGEAGRGFAVVATEIGVLATNSAQVATEIREVSAEVIATVDELAKEAEAMVKFMDETAMKGYQKLLETSDSYQSDVGNMNQVMVDFATQSQELKNNIDYIKDAISAVNIAVEESTKGVTSVTENSVDLTERVANIGQESYNNKEIAEQLNTEVNKFKLN